MAEIYTVEFKNASEKPWYMSVHQKFPNHRRLESVAWQVATLPPQLVYGLPSRQAKSWEVKYGVCLANYDEEERKFTPSRVMPAILGRQYEVVCDDNGDPIISKNPGVETVRSDLIVFKNNTSNPVQTLNLGFAVDNNIVAIERSVGGQLKVTYPAKSTYYIGCHHRIVPGQQVDNCAVLNPIKLEFTEGSYTRSIVVQKDPEGNYQLQSIENETLEPRESAGIKEERRDEEIDGGQETYYGGTADIQVNNKTPDNFWPNYCSKEDLLALIFVCGLMMFVTGLLLTVILFLCLLLVAYLLTFVCVFLLTI